MKLKRKVLAFLMAAAMLLPQMPVAFAEGSDPVAIDLETVRDNGSGYTIDWPHGILYIEGDGSYLITSSNRTTTTRVVVNAENAHITLKNVSIMAVNTPFSIDDGSTVNLTLEGSNALRFTDGNYTGAGLYVPANAAVVIDGSGSLTANGNKSGAGIGGMGAGGDAGSITINSGAVTANGGPYAAGIGGGNNENGTAAGNGGNITINGGSVTATGGTHASGIGGGCRGAGGNITINGGGVNATGYHSAAIGGGFTGNTGTIKITGGFVTATAGSIGSGIGRAPGDGNSSGGGSILVSGGTVFATATGSGMPGLGSWGSQVSGGDTATDTTTLQITGGSVRSTPAPIAPPNGVSEPLYLTTVSIEGANALNKELHYKIDGGDPAGVRTDESGRLYFWLTAGTHALAVILDGQLYQTDLEVSAQNGNPHTLAANPDGTFVPIESIGWMGANGPELIAGVPFDLSGTLEITPHNATYDSIIWSIEDAGSTGAAMNGTALTASSPGTIRLKITVKRFGVALNSWTASVAVKASGDPASGEQFSLTPGGTYYFDLSGQGISGTLNTNLPDSGLHWVPFTYTGKVNAYSRTSEGVSTNDTVSVSDRSLFVADYNVIQAVPWDSLNSAGLIFGKDYGSGGVSYKLRSLSVGSTSSGELPASSGIPANNEWDEILNKNAGLIKNWNELYTLGQDTYSSSSVLYGARGYSSARDYYGIFGGANHSLTGFRPALEITSDPANELKTVIFNMDGNGTLGSGSLTSATVVYTGTLTLPEITAANGFNYSGSELGTPGWYAGSTFYAPGAMPSLATGTILTMGYDPVPAITTSTLPNGTKDVSYSQTLTATGSTPITWSLYSGILPAGLTLNTTTGEISGMPTTEGTSTFTVKAENSAGIVTKELSITINPDPDFVAVTAACSKAQNASYSNMTQEVATSETVIADALKATAVAAVNDSSVTVTINKVSYDEPTAGTADNPSGTNGSYSFKVHVTKGAWNQDTYPDKTIIITATAYTGLSNAQAVMAAKAALVDGTVDVAYGASQDDKTAAVKNYVNNIISNTANAAGVTATVTYNSSTGKYDVALSKGTANGSVSLTMTMNEAADPVIDAAISPASVNYDLSSPSDISTTITWNSASTVTDVVYGVTSLTTPDYYVVTGSNLTIKNSYLSTQGFSEGDTAEFAISFDKGDSAMLTVNIVDNYIPSGNASLSDLTVGGITVSGFDTDIISYNVELPYGTQPGSSLATVGAIAYDTHAAVTITQASSLPGSATVKVTAEDKVTTKIYTVNFTIGAVPTVSVTNITVSGAGGATGVEVGSTLQMQAAVSPGNATNKSVTWSIASGSGATINASGLLTATAAGTVTVRATAQDGSGVYGEKEITITNAAPSTHSITVQNDGHGRGIASAVSAVQGATITLSNTPDSGYHFKEWQAISPANLSINGNTFIMPDEAVVVKAIFEADTAATCTVTFNSDGLIYAVKTVQAGASLGSVNWPANPAKSGYTFNGWYTGANGTGSAFTSATTVTSTMTVYAKWTVNSGGSTGGGSNGGGGSSDRGGTSSVPSTSAPTYNANVSGTGAATATLPVAVNASAGSAAVNVDAKQGNIITGGGAAVITVPSIPGVNSYTLGIPADCLSAPGGKGTLTFNSDVGSMTLPSGMLAGVEGKKAEITIGQGDKSRLPEAAKVAIGDRPLIQLTVAIDGKQTEWNNPDAPVAVSIPYTATAAELANPESIVIWYIDGSGNVLSVPNGHYDPAIGTVTFITTHFSNYAVGYNRVSFKDVAAGAWYSKAVSFIAARGITAGTDNGNYRPEAELTRGEFLVMLMKAYEIAPDTNPVNNFSDAGDTYYNGYMAAAKRLGITRGIGGNLFAPGREISRQEMFTILYNALKTVRKLPGGTNGKTLSAFSDSEEIASWAKDAMLLMVETGIAGGNGGKLAPASTTTRAEMAQVLYNLLAK